MGGRGGNSGNSKASEQYFAAYKESVFKNAKVVTSEPSDYSGSELNMFGNQRFIEYFDGDGKTFAVRLLKAEEEY